ncbi:MAG: carbohydrate-binding protein [Pedobacter sp.]|nr:MAG: carbohydrate-binding protein [Pedobacter sp.]
MLINTNYESVNAQGFLRTKDKNIIDESGKNILLRSMGLGGWMLQEGYMLGINGEGQQHTIKRRIKELIGEEQTAGFYEKWLTNHTTKADVDSMKAWGFNSVRLAMHYDLYTLPVEKEPKPGENTWIDQGFSMTDSLLAWCKANQMYVILDLHGAPGGQGNDFNISDRDPSKPSLWDSEANQQKMVALWRKLAERYKDEQWIGAYDIINEPNWGFQNRDGDKHGLQEKQNIPLRELMVKVTKAIREVDQKHIIIIEGNGWGNNYSGIFPLWDNNLVVSYHKYWAHNDQASVNGMLDVRNQHNVPVWLGETGENSNVWFTEAISLFERNNIGWAWWPLKKLGHNNPLQVNTNANYQLVLDYWNGKGPKPTEKQALNGLMKLADDLKITHNIVKYDVIDAMFRQPFTTDTKPFKPNVISDNVMIRSVDYDLGRNGYAYFDNDTADYHVSTGKTTAGNNGRMYRNDGVDIKKDAHYYITDIEKGEWVQYTVDVKQEGVYTLRFGVATNDNQGQLLLKTTDGSISKTLTLPNTGGLDKFKEVNVANVRLSAGKQKIRIHFKSSNFNFSYIRFNK